MIDVSNKEIWFLTGSQHLYGDEALKQVADHVETMIRELNATGNISVKIVGKPTLIDPGMVTNICIEANASPQCIGVITWMHTFSPAKMWINGLTKLSKPLCHLHTQYNAAIPWGTIDMDFMNLNQSAHGDREFGFMMSRLRKNRKVVVGHWQSKSVQDKIDVWARVCLGWDEMQNLKVARIGDNMREVAVTEGDKVEAQMKFGFATNGFGPEDLMQYIDDVSTSDINSLMDEYGSAYNLANGLQPSGDKRSSLVEAARIEIGLRHFLDSGGFKAYTDTFENLGRMRQLPGIASQRLMADGYGFGGEGDWKTAAMVRVMKVMAQGKKGGTSFMEDYTYHFSDNENLVLGAHMLEICPSIAAAKPSCEVHPLGIGGKEDPVRLVFDSPAGPALNASLVDMGNRFRLIVNTVDAVAPKEQLPKLPVARVLWDPHPNLDIAATAWILGGGAHHTVYTQALDINYMEDFADIAGIELLVIDKETRIRDFKNLIHHNEVYYQHKQ
jgi:L-arabinose isomerase